jgi:hypothetical protein
MAIAQVVAGAYSSTYSATDCGDFTKDGFEIEIRTHGERVEQTDKFGKSLLDIVHAGSSCFVSFESMIFKAGSLAPFYPWGSLGVIATTAAPIGRLASNVAAALVLTVVANTPADGTTPSLDTFTGSKAILPDGANLRLLFSSRVRSVPVQLALLPSETTGTVSFFSTS